MVSIERLTKYLDLPPEGEFKTKPEIKKTLKESWPSNDTSIEVKNLNFRYR